MLFYTKNERAKNTKPHLFTHIESNIIIFLLILCPYFSTTCYVFHFLPSNKGENLGSNIIACVKVLKLFYLLRPFSQKDSGTHNKTLSLLHVKWKKGFIFNTNFNFVSTNDLSCWWSKYQFCATGQNSLSEILSTREEL
jgi:hypothetical protein